MLDALTAFAGAESLMAVGVTDMLDGLVISTEFSWGLLAILLCVLIGLGQPLYVVLGTVTAFLLLTLPDPPPQKPFALALNALVEETRVLSDKVELLAIPFFVLAGAIMTKGDIARRLINVARACFCWLPGGLAVSAVAACMFFAAISGSSPVTVIAIGTMMFPVLVEEGYSERFSTGVVTSAGSLGILIPPSIPMLIFAIVLGQVEGGWVEPFGVDGGPAYGNLVAESGLDNVGALFLAGIGPGIMIGGALAAYSVFIGFKQKVNTEPFSFKNAFDATREGFWALSLPVLILGGIYTGTFTVTQAAAVAVVYSFLVEVFIHGELELRDVPKIFSESAVLMGTLLLIIAMALAFNRYLVKAGIPELAVEMIRDWNMSTLEFLLVLNILLLIVGCLMDIMSAILILVPLLSPIAFEMGIHPVHLAVIFIVNLEIGYLTPPLGLNLFVSSTIFKKPIGEVVMSVLPFTAIIGACVLVVTYVPAISLGPLAIMAGKSPWIGFPETITAEEADALASAPVGNEKSISDLMNEDEGTTVTNDAGEVVSYEPPADQLMDQMGDVPDDAFDPLLDLSDYMNGYHMHVTLERGKVLEEAQFVALATALYPVYEATNKGRLKKGGAFEVLDAVMGRVEGLDDAGLVSALGTDDPLGVSAEIARVEAAGGGEDVVDEPVDDGDDEVDDSGDTDGGMMQGLPPGLMDDDGLGDDDDLDEDEDTDGGVMPGLPPGLMDDDGEPSDGEEDGTDTGDGAGSETGADTPPGDADGDSAVADGPGGGGGGDDASDDEPAADGNEVATGEDPPADGDGPTADEPGDAPASGDGAPATDE